MTHAILTAIDAEIATITERLNRLYALHEAAAAIDAPPEPADSSGGGATSRAGGARGR